MDGPPLFTGASVIEQFLRATIMMRCDLCDKECQLNELRPLLNDYQVSGVQHLCPTCAKWANKAKSDLILGIAPQMRLIIAEKALLRQRQSWLTRVRTAAREYFSNSPTINTP